MCELLQIDPSGTDNSYWLERLAGDLPESAPLRDFTRPLPYRCEKTVLEINIAAELGKALTRRESITPGSLRAFLIACIQILLSRHTGQTDVIVGAVKNDTSHTIIPIRSKLAPDTPFSDFVRELETLLTADFEHADMFQPGNNRRKYPFDIAMGIMHELDAPVDLLCCEIVIGFKFYIRGGMLEAEAEYNGLLYRADSIRPLVRQLIHIIMSAFTHPNMSIDSIPLFDEEELHRILYGFNNNQCDFPRDRTLSALIEEQVGRSPDVVCAIHGERSLTFRQINAEANQLGRLLRSLGVGPGSFVVILEYRGLGFLTAMLAIWKAGGVYIPVDPSYPEDRVRYMLLNSEAKVVVGGRTALDQFSGVAQTMRSQFSGVICIDEHDTELAFRYGCEFYNPAAYRDLPVSNLDPIASSADPAYMIYTSGSTGLPKGAIIRHDGAINHIYAQSSSLGCEGIKHFLQSAPSSSDISVWQFVAPLVLGGKTVIIDNASDVENVVEQIQRHNLSILEVVPVIMKHLIDYLESLEEAERSFPNLRWVMITGERAPVELCNAWLSLFPSVPVVNAYGPTEAADDITQALIRDPLPPTQVTVPIGRPLANLDIYILDSNLRPVPIGVPGEICVAGIGVGNGYWKEPENTCANFCPTPFSGSRGSVMYRTGDIGRLRDDGTIECFGRKDHQIQLRGFRIELGEIEAVLRSYPNVEEAVVKAFPEDSGTGSLAAFIIPRPGAIIDRDGKDIRAFMARFLAAQMIPSSIVIVDRLPLTPAGKIDRKVLTLPERCGTRIVAPYEAPRTSIETIMTQIWQHELNIKCVGIRDSFFDLGGDSLAAVSIVVATRMAGFHIRPLEVLQCVTVANLAAIARPLTITPAATPVQLPTVTPITPLKEELRDELLHREPHIEDVYPLSPTQQGIYVESILSCDKSIFVDQYCYTLNGPLDPEAFQASWDEVCNRHPIIKTSFVRKYFGRPLQVVLRDIVLPFEFLDWSNLNVVAHKQELISRRNAEVRKGFVLGAAPLMRFILIRLEPQVHYLIWTHHHLIVDGWSMTLIMREVLSFYGARCRAIPPNLGQVAPYRQYIDWLQRQDIASAEIFWRNYFAGWNAPSLKLPQSVNPRPSHGEKSLYLCSSVTSALGTSARNNKVTQATILQAGWALLLSRLTGCGDVLFGVVVSGRQISLEHIESMVGLFVTILPLRLGISAHIDIKHWLPGIQDQAAVARDHEAVPLSKIQSWVGVPANKPLFETLFVMSNYPQFDSRAHTELAIELAEFRTVPASPITLIVVPGNRLLLRLVYDRQRFSGSNAVEVLRHYADILTKLGAGIDPRLGHPPDPSCRRSFNIDQKNILISQPLH